MFYLFSSETEKLSTQKKKKKEEGKKKATDLLQHPIPHLADQASLNSVLAQ
jgi:hypothetical protein